MSQIIVGGDHQDAFHICDALEGEVKDSSVSVIFCATPQELLTTLSRGGAYMVILDFESAGLTNYELALRIREMGGADDLPLLLPDVDVLGDIRAMFGNNAVAFAHPVDPAEVASKARMFLADREEALKAAKSLSASSGQTGGGTAAQRASAPNRQRKPGSGPGVAGGTEPTRKPVDVPVADGRQGRNRRVRHRTWNEVHTRQESGSRTAKAAPRREGTIPDDDDIVVYGDDGGGPGRSRRKSIRLLVALLVVAGLVVAGNVAWWLLGNREDGGDSEAGDLTEIQCLSCGQCESRAVTNIQDERCRKCGKPMGFAFHCNDCKKDFAYGPPEGVKVLGDLKKKPDCPACKSWNVRAVAPSPEEKSEEED